MRAAHTAPQRKRYGRARRYAAGAALALLAASALAWALALAMLVSALCGVFLLLLGLAAVIVRIPPRAALWALAFGSMPLAHGLPDSWIGTGWLPELLAGGIISATCLGALTWLRTRQRLREQKRWRETGGRMGAAPRITVFAGWRVTRIAMTNTERLDRAEADLRELREREEFLERWQEEVDALRKINGPKLECLAGIVRAAHEDEGVPVPAELQATCPTIPLPKLRLVWDARRAEGA